MHYSYFTKGTCAKRIDFEIEDGLVGGISFEGGCKGNLQGIARLSEGRRPEELVSILAGVRCGEKKTSCPDQLAKALKKHSRSKNAKKTK